MAIEYSWSICQEQYHGPCASREEAALEAVIECDLVPGNTMWVGENSSFDVVTMIRSSIHADYILEHLGEYAYDEVGEAAEEWPDVSAENRKKLDEALVQVIAPFLDEPRFWSVAQVVKVEVTLAMFQKAHPLDGPPHCKRCFGLMEAPEQEACEEDGEPCEALTAADYEEG